MATKVRYIDCGSAEAERGLKPILALKNTVAEKTNLILKGAFPSKWANWFDPHVSGSANGPIAKED
ncbi:MAG: hypothetical protein ACXVCN_11350 [Bdellovibrio sp.]